VQDIFNLNSYSELIRGISNADTRISSLAVNHVNILYYRMAVYQTLNT